VIVVEKGEERDDDDDDDDDGDDDGDDDDDDDDEEEEEEEEEKEKEIVEEEAKEGKEADAGNKEEDVYVEDVRGRIKMVDDGVEVCKELIIEFDKETTCLSPPTNISLSSVVNARDTVDPDNVWRTPLGEFPGEAPGERCGEFVGEEDLDWLFSPSANISSNEITSFSFARRYFRKFDCISLILSSNSSKAELSF